MKKLLLIIGFGCARLAIAQDDPILNTFSLGRSSGSKGVAGFRWKPRRTLTASALQALARQRGFVPQGDETIVDIVFQDGLSTADQVTETSGRGVSLAAVRALCRQLGGDAQLTSNDRGSGAMLIMRYRKTLTKAREIA